MPNFSNSISSYPHGSCGVAGLECHNNHITIYEGNQEVCRAQGCVSSPNKIATQLYHTVLGVREFFWMKFKLNGIDGKGEIPPLQIGWDQNNAQWTCSSSLSQSCYFRFNDRYAVQPKVVAHEYTHAIIARLCPLNYRNQSGALNESLADVFGIAFSYFSQGNASWQIANRDLSRHVHAGHDQLPLSKQPSHLNDHGHVHTNSCIPNHAYFVAVQLTGESPDGEIMQIWFDALLGVTPDEFFYDFASKTITKAYDDYDANFAYAVQEAWIHVGVVRASIPAPIQEQANGTLARSRNMSERNV